MASKETEDTATSVPYNRTIHVKMVKVQFANCSKNLIHQYAYNAMLLKFSLVGSQKGQEK